MNNMFSLPICLLQGCMDVLIAWMRHTADILFVLGYCVIAFLKLCFLGILRYEIKEMIQKIKLLQTEMAQAILNAEMGDQNLQQVRRTTASAIENRFQIESLTDADKREHSHAWRGAEGGEPGSGVDADRVGGERARNATQPPRGHAAVHET